MITIRNASQRGHTELGWLNSRHTFSFGDYLDPSRMGFRTLRVVNDDRVRQGTGFGTHSHRDMEILTYVLDGELAHHDSLGNGLVIRPGELQRMTAGTGVSHSEKNPSATAPVHFLQIWILPERRNLPPGYEQKAFPIAERRGKLRLSASHDGTEGSLSIHQDVKAYTGLFDGAERGQLELSAGRAGWVQVARGSIELNGQLLEEGDGAEIVDERRLELANGEGAEVVVFDLGA